MYTVDLTVNELYNDIYSTRVIGRLLRCGIEIYSEKLTVSALEELVRRGECGLIAEELDYAFSHGQFHQDSNLLCMVAKVLCLGSVRGGDKDSIRYGEFLLSGGFMSPSEWLQCEDMKR